MNDEFDPALFETLIHLLEVSVVIGIAVIVYITKKYSKEMNTELEKKLNDEVDLSSDQ